MVSEVDLKQAIVRIEEFLNKLWTEFVIVRRGAVKEKKTIVLGKKKIEAFCINILEKNLIILKGEKGYIMCGYLNLNAANKFKEAAVKVTGVSTINDALGAKVHSCTYAAKKIGIRKNQPIKDVLKIIA